MQTPYLSNALALSCTVSGVSGRLISGAVLRKSTETLNCLSSVPRLYKLRAQLCCGRNSRLRRCIKVGLCRTSEAMC
jgi:hypothetical protein